MEVEPRCYNRRMSKSRRMYVFADESGDADCPGRMEYFVFSAVAFASEKSRDDLQLAVQDFCKDNQLKSELKFSRCRENLLSKFFITIGDLHFRHSSCIFRKTEAGGQWKVRQYVYERVVREVVNGLVPHFREVEGEDTTPLKVSVVHDEHTDNCYTRTIADEFKKPRAKSGRPFIDDVRSGKSASSPFLQFADLLCGAVRWNTSAYRKFISRQRLAMVELP